SRAPARVGQAVARMPRSPPERNGDRATSRRVPDLVVTRLGRCEQREQAAVGLEIYKWRTIDAIEPAHEKVCSFEPYKRHELRPDQVRSDRRADGKSAAGNAVI